MPRTVSLLLLCLVTSACRRERPCGDLEHDPVRNVCVCPAGTAWDGDAAGCAADGGTVAADSGRDGPEDGGCEDPLGTIENCSACGEGCGWSCAGITEGCNDAVAIGAGPNHTCVARQNGEVWCWGWNGLGVLGSDGLLVEPTLMPKLSNAIDVDGAAYVSSQHTCVVTRAGLVLCWGTNSYGELGDGTTDDRFAPVEAYGVRAATRVATADGRSCAVTASGLYCWGEFGRHVFPARVGGLPDPLTDVAVRSASACAIAAGGAWCWGSNSEGELGDGTTEERSSPVRPLGLSSEVTAIALGSGHACAVSAGRLYCWGSNDSGQLGTGNTTPTSTPTPVDLPGDVRDVGAGRNHTCALLRDDSLYCWGRNNEGQVGDGSSTNRLAPVHIRDVAARSLALGMEHSCVLDASGAVRCWGINADGQVGDGTTFGRTVPTAVATH